MIALWCILSAGWFAVVPFLSWSSTLRQLRTRRPIFTCWTFLIAVGGTCAGITLRGGRPFKIYWATAAAICTSNSDYHQDPAELYLSSWFAWSFNNCTSQCGSLEPGLSLRTGTQMVPIIQTELSNFQLPVIIDKETLGSLTGCVSPIVFIQWIYACWSGSRTPSEARDRICIKLFKKRSSFQRMRSTLAVSIALCVYTFACASLTVCPFLFVFNIIFNEMNMLYLPQDEPLTAVGQWSQWVVIILVIMAAVINKYHDSWSRGARKSWENAVRPLFIHKKRLSPDRNDLERCEARELSSLQVTVRKVAQPKPLTSCEPLALRKTMSQHLTDPLREAWLHFRQECGDFYRWVRNPIDVSRSNTAFRKIMAARAEHHGRFRAHSPEQMEHFSPIFRPNSQIELTNLLTRSRSRSV